MSMEFFHEVYEWSEVPSPGKVRKLNMYDSEKYNQVISKFILRHFQLNIWKSFESTFLNEYKF